MSDINITTQDSQAINSQTVATTINAELDSQINIEQATDTINITTEEAQTINITLDSIIDTESGASDFLSLTDTPSSYLGQASKYVAVKQSETGLEFVEPGDADITGVTAGTGLSGGGTSGNITLNLNTTYTNTLYSQLGHVHDDRYYTETEIDNANFLNEEGANEFYLRKDQNLADLSDWSIALESLRLTSENENEGASNVYIHDADGRYDSRDVEGAFRETMIRAANLSDLIDIEEARTNLEVYSDAEIDTMLEGYLASENNLSDIGNAATARGNLDVQSISESDARYIRRANNSTKDQGYEQNSSVDGITAGYISDKTLHNVALKGHPGTKQVGSIWTDNTVTPSVLYIRLNGVDNTIKYDFTTASSELEHTPLSYLIDVWSGNSNQLGNNGLPLVQEYKTSMGAYPVPLLIDGGSF